MNTKNKKSGILVLLVTMLLSGLAFAQEGSGNVGADAIITEVSGLVPVAAAVVGAAVLVIVVPWGAKLAIRAFRAITGG